MLDPFKAQVVTCPSVFVYAESSARWKRVPGEPALEEIGILENNERRHRPAMRIHALDHGHPFPVTGLDLLLPCTPSEVVTTIPGAITPIEKPVSSKL